VNLLLAWSPDQSKLVIANQNQGDNSVDAVICTPDLKIQSRFTLRYQLIGSNAFAPSFTGIAWPFARYIVFSSNEQMSVQNTAAVDRLYVIDTQQIQHRWPVVTEQDTSGIDTVINADNALTLPPASSNGLVAVVHNKSIVVGQIDVTTNPPSWRQRTKIGVLPVKAGNPDQLKGGRWSANGTYLVGFGVEPGTLLYLPWQQDQQGGKQLTYKLAVPDASDGSGPDIITCIATNPASLSPGLAGGTFDGSIYLWNFRANGQPVRKLDSNGIAQDTVSVAWSPDGRWLAASFLDQNTSILIWKLT
jgi:WD40 repeat protein